MQSLNSCRLYCQRAKFGIIIQFMYRNLELLQASKEWRMITEFLEKLFNARCDPATDTATGSSLMEFDAGVYSIIFTLTI